MRRWIIKQIISSKTPFGGITKEELFSATLAIDPGLHPRVFNRDLEVILSSPVFQMTHEGMIIQIAAGTRRSA
ncbi:MAG: hypothetical protein VKM34_04910 [Cyanobacteriota bacterium]|nr:hypothetical protein [Cyanobacteriota bacterium]